MNKKGQINIGVLILGAIAVIVCLIILQQVASNVAQTTGSNGVSTVSQGQYTGVLNTNVELVGQELVTLTSVTNRTGGNAIPALNYTVSECVRASNSLKGICYKSLAAGESSGPVNITYTYYPAGYADDAGSRAIAAIIILLAAIGIAVILLPNVRELF